MGRDEHAGMLTQAQIDEFKRDGVLTFRGFFSPDEIAPLRANAVHHFGDPRTPGEWRAALAQRVSEEPFFVADAPTPMDHRGLAALFASLHENAQWQGANQLIPLAPAETTEWNPPQRWHMDFPGAGLVPVPPPVRLLANVVIYLSDVAGHGGAFTFRRASHHVAWDHFRAHPQDYCAFGFPRLGEIFDTMTARLETEPEQFVGEPGDILLHHSMLLHSGSTNATSETRLGLFSRWGTAVREGEPHYDFGGDMWANWRFRARETSPASDRDSNQLPRMTELVQGRVRL